MAFGCLALVLIVGGCSWLFSGKDENLTNNSTTENVTASVEAVNFKPTEDQARAIDFSRSILLETTACKSDADNVQELFNRLAQSEVGAADVYSAVRSGIKSCEGNAAGLNEIEIAALKAPEAVRIAEQARNSCVAAVQKRMDALKKAKIFLDGNGGLSTAADYKDGMRSALNDEAACRMTLAGVPAHFHVPESETEFLR